MGRNSILPATSGPISLFYGPEPYHSSHLRPNIPIIRAGTAFCQPPPAQYPYYMGRNSILPTSSGPPKSFIRAGGKTTETGRSTAQQSKRREGVPGEFLLRPGPSPEAPERSRKNADGHQCRSGAGKTLTDSMSQRSGEDAEEQPRSEESGGTGFRPNLSEV